ncbi:MAG: YfhO family protein [Candidatus Marinimicrobia bacterium]|jgi:hypothetical protein|nr:YfhO family protein [Candidatus Neomarinimicrobiota bacterium]MBT4068403.1 YfhO family protein [Candidatus Neomarinimicrobiota bacterium]MBT4372477.1 YfhO family protein [Candidatus Neomarinimicrobiota bacterium]MBT4809030.1 YfhO family protein [Candidatus Neomarinimicrobiota bacterium]MBT5176923.1 YfhO family protein [Candidatus Neomarinimicrobiota bacterium]
MDWKNPVVIASGLMLVIIAVLFEPVIFGGKTFGSPDSLSPKAIGIALNDLSEESGEFPQWQPWVFSGMPTAEAFTNLSKLYFPEYFFKLFFLPGLIIQLLHLLFAGIGGFLLLRHFKCSEWAAGLGATAFMITPYMVTMVVFGHGSQMMTAAYIPWILWLTVRLWQNPNLWDSGWLALLLGFQLQRAHAQIAYYTWLLIGAYILIQLVDGLRNPNKRLFLGKGLGLFSFACLVGIGISILIYLPAMDYTPFSVRGGSASGGADYNYATGWSFHPKEILTFFIPSAFGFGGQPYWGYMPFTDYPNYMGIIILLLAVIGLFRKWELIHQFLVITSLFALFISFGKHFSLVYDFFFNIFPYFNKFRVPHMILILLQFNVAVLAAFGLDDLVKLKKENIPKWFWGITGAIGLFLIVMVLGGSAIESAVRSSFGPPRLQDPRAAQTLNNMRWDLWQKDAWMMILFSGSLISLTWLWIKRKISQTMLLASVVTLAVIDIGIVNHKIIQPSRASGRGSQLMSTRAVDRFFQEDEIIKFLKQDDSNFRIYPIGGLFGESRFAAFGLESVGGYHPAKLRDYNTFLSKTGNAAALPVLRMMNVKYLVSPQKINHPELKSVMTGEIKSSRGNVPVEVLEVSNPLERAWFVSRSEIVSEDDIWGKVIQSDFNPLKIAFVNESIKISSDSKGLITNFEKSANRIGIMTESTGDQFLVLSEIHYPLRWKATIDGIEVKTYKVNGILRGVEVPAGSHTVEFKFDKSSFNNGLIVSFASFGLAIGFIVFGFLFREKHG